ncbi:hypothetical protein HaLaN_14131, partial [Haematococcus lacustris]
MAKQHCAASMVPQADLMTAMPDAALASPLLTTGLEVIRQAGSAAARQATVQSSGKRHSR